MTPGARHTTAVAASTAALAVALAGLTGCSLLQAKTYTVADCTPIMMQYAESDESTAAELCAGSLEQLGQADFDTDIAAMEESVKSGHTARQDQEEGLDTLLSDLGIGFSLDGIGPNSDLGDVLDDGWVDDGSDLFDSGW